MPDVELTIYAAFYGISWALTTLAFVYLWLKSDLLNPVQGFLEDRKHLAVARFLLCGYCFGSWTYLTLWFVTVLYDRPHFNLTLLAGAGAGLGLFYYSWAAFRRNYLPV